jgi:hypothetical protein
MNRSCRFVLATSIAAILASASSVPSSRADDKKEEGWIQLFNGKDLTGWKMFDPPSGEFKGLKEVKNSDGKVTSYVGELKKGGEVTLWRVEDGTIIGGGPSSHLFTDIEADNFRYRVEAKINDKGNSGQYFRTKFGPGFPQGYETQINATHGDPIRTGSIYPAGNLRKYKDKICVMNTAPHKPDEYFTQEVIADGPVITVIVNGKTTLDHWEDPDKTFTSGHFALQGHDPGSIMTFKKVEYMPIKK